MNNGFLLGSLSVLGSATPEIQRLPYVKQTVSRDFKNSINHPPPPNPNALFTEEQKFPIGRDVFEFPVEKKKSIGGQNLYSNKKSSESMFLGCILFIKNSSGYFNSIKYRPLVSLFFNIEI